MLSPRDPPAVSRTWWVLRALPGQVPRGSSSTEFWRNAPGPSLSATGTRTPCPPCRPASLTSASTALATACCVPLEAYAKLCTLRGIRPPEWRPSLGCSRCLFTSDQDRTPWAVRMSPCSADWKPLTPRETPNPALWGGDPNLKPESGLLSAPV